MVGVLKINYKIYILHDLNSCNVENKIPRNWFGGGSVSRYYYFIWKWNDVYILLPRVYEFQTLGHRQW